MGPALVGLVGVIVGALVSGGATYMMARRADARQARAAARLLEAELQAVVEQLGELGQAIAFRDEFARRAEDESERDEISNAWDLKSMLRIPQPRLWEKHKSLLADVLSAADWYALAKAYQSIDDLRVISSSERWFTAQGEFIHHAIEEVVTDLGNEIQAGATAVSRLAGGRIAWPQSAETGTARWLVQRRSKSDHPGGSAQNEASDLSPTDPSSNPSALGYLQPSRLRPIALGTLLLWNARSHTDAHGHGCPCAPAIQHSGGAEVTVALHR